MAYLFPVLGRLPFHTPHRVPAAHDDGSHHVATTQRDRPRAIKIRSA